MNAGILSNSRRWAGIALSGLVILMLTLDGVTKLTMAPQVIAAMNGIGFPISMTRTLGWLVLTCTLLYAVPRTAVLGAILLTGFLGGATAAKTRLVDPTLFLSVAIGVLAWAGLFLRDERIRDLIPIRSRTSGRRP